MKKKFNVLCMFLLTLFTCMSFISKVSATVSLTVATTDYNKKWYDENGEIETKGFSFFYINDKSAYCIQPYVSTKDGVEYDIVTSIDSYSTSTIRQMSLVAYYGYDYPNHQTLAYKIATQVLIWEIAGTDVVSVYNKYTYEEFDYSAEYNEIKSLVSNHYTKPDFGSTTYTVNLGETVTLTDTNGVLDEYDVTCTNADVCTQDGNTLTIRPSGTDTVTVSLTKKQYYSDSTLFYYDGEHQTLITPGSVDPITASVTINVTAGSVSIQKVDSETTTVQGQATLSGAVYGVYTSSGTLITTLTTDSSGYASTDNILAYGSYYVQEISSSQGYKLDSTRYSFELSSASSTQNVTLTVKEEVIKNYISILKQYKYVDGNTTFLNAEYGITFNIYYSDGTYYSSITTDKNGYATLELPYGVWKFSQVNSTTGYEKIYDFYVTVDENSETEQYYNILNNAISAYLQVYKIDSETGNTIAIENTTFKILNTDTGEYVSQYVGGKVYSEFTTDENGVMVTYLELEAGNYKLIEVSSPSGYLLSSDDLTFTIGDSTYYTYTTYGTFITLYFENTSIKGQIEIYKTGEDFTVENGTYYYSEKALSNVTFEIYASSDILSSDGTYLYYSKGDLVDTIITDENGYAISKELSIGSYYLKEVSTQENYLLSDEVYYFDIVEIDNLTPIVYVSYCNLNILSKGSLEFSKTDYITGEAIPDTVIEIYTESDELIGTYTTDENGKVTIDDLVVGKYYIIEIEATTGYLLSDEIVYFEILEDGEIVKAEMTNKPITGTLEFSKTDYVKGEAIPNTIIEIYTESDELIGTYTTDENGKVTIDELRYGKYYIVEIEATTGYLLSDEIVYFEILEDGEIVKAEMTNKPITGTLEFSKTDYVTGEAISNTIIEIYTESDELIGTYTTDENGKVTIDELRYGKYYIIEIEATTGYLLSDEIVYFEILEDGEIVKVEMTNKPITGTLEFSKTDYVTGEAIPDTVIEIYTESDELIGTYTTDENGKVTIDELRYGKYYIIEIEATTGYLLSDEIVYFEILEDGEIVKAEMTNEIITSLVIIHKVDTNGNYLSGVTIGVYDLDGNLIYSGITDESGNIEIELNYGSYYIKEISTIDGYILSDEEIYFEVIQNNDVIELTLTNEELIVEVPNAMSNEVSIDTILLIVLSLIGIGLIVYDKKNKR